MPTTAVTALTSMDECTRLASSPRRPTTSRTTAARSISPSSSRRRPAVIRETSKSSSMSRVIRSICLNAFSSFGFDLASAERTAWRRSAWGLKQHLDL